MSVIHDLDFQRCYGIVPTLNGAGELLAMNHPVNVLKRLNRTLVDCDAAER